MDWFKTNRMYCMENETPAAKTITFKSGCGKGVCWNEYRNKEEDSPIRAHSYMQPCGGDSGSGQFIRNGYDNNAENIDKFKYVLTSIHTTSVGDTFELRGKSYVVPCGIYSYDATNSKPGRRVYYKSLDISQSTTYSDTLVWIKQKANF